jgi:hypothetical protein
MKCDRRWWNDGRLEREQAACVEQVMSLPAQTHVLGDDWVALTNAHLSASLAACWLRLLAGDPTGQPWHEVLAVWAPSSAGTFFGVRRP